MLLLEDLRKITTESQLKLEGVPQTAIQLIEKGGGKCSEFAQEHSTLRSGQLVTLDDRGYLQASGREIRMSGVQGEVCREECLGTCRRNERQDYILSRSVSPGNNHGGTNLGSRPFLTGSEPSDH